VLGFSGFPPTLRGL